MLPILFCLHYTEYASFSIEPDRSDASASTLDPQTGWGIPATTHRQGRVGGECVAFRRTVPAPKSSSAIGIG
jgi:hypothetical protein